MCLYTHLKLLLLGSMFRIIIAPRKMHIFSQVGQSQLIMLPCSVRKHSKYALQYWTEHPELSTSEHTQTTVILYQTYIQLRMSLCELDVVHPIQIFILAFTHSVMEQGISDTM